MAHAAEKGRYEDGYEHWYDWQTQPKAALAFGSWVREWEHLTETPWPSVGAFSARHFDPDDWREAYPYWPFFECVCPSSTMTNTGYTGCACGGEPGPPP